MGLFFCARETGLVGRVGGNYFVSRQEEGQIRLAWLRFVVEKLKSICFGFEKERGEKDIHIF